MCICVYISMYIRMYYISMYEEILLNHCSTNALTGPHFAGPKWWSLLPPFVLNHSAP